MRAVELVTDTMKLPVDDPLAVVVTAAIKAGRAEELQQLLCEHEGLATARIVDAAQVERTLLKIARERLFGGRCAIGVAAFRRPVGCSLTVHRCRMP